MSYHTLPTKYCFAEYEFYVEFVTCVQCALKSQVIPQCGDGIEFKTEFTRGPGRDDTCHLSLLDETLPD